MTSDQLYLVLAMSSICLAIVILSGLCALWANRRDRAKADAAYTAALIESGLTRQPLTPEEIVRRYDQQ